MNPSPSLSAIPTHIITGFLGSGKTTAILSLLKAKPVDERWAILVNEFGDVGIDGSLLEGLQAKTNQVFIREVPGGCMCCASGVPMQIALTQLLKQARPDRLLIEPTGLGHPKEVLKALQAQYYQNVLDIQKIVTLVDARKLSDERYTQHQTFKDQITIADIVVGNKADLYEAGDTQILFDFVHCLGIQPEHIQVVKYGELLIDSIVGSTKHTPRPVQSTVKPVQTFITLDLPNQKPIDSKDLKATINKGEGFSSIGWQFPASTVFDRVKIDDWIHQLISTQAIERLKAVLVTTDGNYAYNVANDGLSEVRIEICNESRLEIIATNLDERWQEQILACCGK